MGISASLKELTRKAKEDETFRAALTQAQSPQDVVAISNRAGIALTLKELQAGMSGSSGGELSEEQLAGVAGGLVGHLLQGIVESSEAENSLRFITRF